MQRSVRVTCFVLGIVAGHLFLGRSALSQDWPQWRGPDRDGAVHGVAVPAHWPQTLKEDWQVPVGEGVSSPVVVGGKVYVFIRQEIARPQTDERNIESFPEYGNEVVLCLDVASGKELWRSEPYPAPRVRGLGAGEMTYGPRSTPTVTDGRIFTLGVSGILSCLDAETGKLYWRKESQGNPPHGASASPLVVDGFCIVHTGRGAHVHTEPGESPSKSRVRPRIPGGLTAVDVSSGEVKWFSADREPWEGPAYGSPILVNLAGERQVVLFTASFNANVIGVSPATGMRLWRLCSTPDKMLDGNGACLTPVQYEDLLIFADLRTPPWAIRLVAGAQGITAIDAWKAEGLSLYYSSPVLAGDLLFGFSEKKLGQLYCLDAKTGRTRWTSDGRLGASASLLNAGTVLLVLTSGGQLLVVKTDGTAYQLIANYRVSDTRTWAHPVLLGDRILIKDEKTLRCYGIEQNDNDKVESQHGF